MYETDKIICPFAGRVCVMNRCHFWQKYSSDVLYSDDPEVGECLLKLATCAVISKLSPKVQEKFYDPVREAASRNHPIEVPF